MKLHDLSPPEGSNDSTTRKGRGRGSTQGESCGRGNKGQKKRSKIPVYFEGGQTPLYRRFPKRGFTPPNQNEIQEVNVGSLNCFSEGYEVTPEDLVGEGLVKQNKPIKLLGDGELEVELNIIIHDTSEGARQKIEDAGGSIKLLSEVNSE